jgi:hypothetical protein
LEVNHEKKLSDDPVCFSINLKETIKYGLSPLSQLKKDPEAKRLFKRKNNTKGAKINVYKGNSQKK